MNKIFGFPGGSDGKVSACSAGDLGSIPGLGRSSGEGKGYPFQDSGLENSVDCIDHGVAKSRWTRLSYFHSVRLSEGPSGQAETSSPVEARLHTLGCFSMIRTYSFLLYSLLVN